MMDDLISRQAAINNIKNGFHWETVNGIMAQAVLKQVIHDIEIMPSVQPEIIRCKDCKWYGRADKRRFYRGMDCLQKRIDTIIPDKDFCSRAERKDNG